MEGGDNTWIHNCRILHLKTQEVTHKYTCFIKLFVKLLSYTYSVEEGWCTKPPFALKCQSPKIILRWNWYQCWCDYYAVHREETFIRNHYKNRLLVSFNNWCHLLKGYLSHYCSLLVKDASAFKFSQTNFVNKVKIPWETSKVFFFNLKNFP